MEKLPTKASEPPAQKTRLASSNDLSRENLSPEDAGDAKRSSVSAAIRNNASPQSHHLAARRSARRIATRISASFMAAILAGGLIAACGDDNSDTTITLYSGRNEPLIGPIIERFEEETGISVDVRYGNSTNLALLIDTEGSNSPADVFISQSPGSIGFLNDKSRLRTLSDELLRLHPETSRSPDGSWVGITGRQRVLVYNPNLVEASELPSSVFELTDPQYRKRVGVAPQNGSFQDFITAMRKERGDDAAADWLRGMAGNSSPNYIQNSAIVDAVIRGEVDMGLVNHYYLFRRLAEEPDAAGGNHYFAPDDIGSLVIVTAGAVLDSSDSAANGEHLLRFLLGEEAQTYFATETKEYPLVAGVEPLPELPPRPELTTAALDFSNLVGGLERTVELIRKSGIEQ